MRTLNDLDVSETTKDSYYSCEDVWNLLIERAKEWKRLSECSESSYDKYFELLSILGMTEEEFKKEVKE